MTTTMSPGAFYRLMSERAALAVELAKKLDEQRVQEESLKAELLSCAPQSMHTYIKNEMGLDTLFKYGMYTGDVRFFDKDYGFRNMEDVKKKIKDLQKAWKGVVKIDVQFVERGDGRANIKFYAVL